MLKIFEHKILFWKLARLCDDCSCASGLWIWNIRSVPSADVPDHGFDDERVTEDDNAERHGEDQRERDPRSHVELKLPIGVRRPAAVTH